MVRVVVDVMPKPEILDPQGKAVHGALARLGVGGVASVRQGKRFELELDDGDGDGTGRPGVLGPDRLAEVERLAATLLANPVIEDYRVTVGPAEPATPATSTGGAWA